MKDKKGILPREVLVLIISVIVIVLLLILTVKFAGIFTSNKGDKQAEELLKQLVQRADSIEDGNVVAFLLTAPNNYFLVTQENRICACHKNTLSGFDQIAFGDELEAKKQFCIDKGVSCEPSKFNLNIFSSSLSKVDGIFFIEEAPMNLFLKREGNNVEIMSKKDYAGMQSANSLLEFKSESGKTIQELVRDYLVAGDSVKTSIEQELEKTLKNYYDQYDSEKLLELKKDNFAMGFYLKNKGEGVAFLSVELNYRFLRRPFLKTFETYDLEINGNNYQIVIYYSSKYGDIY